MSRPITIPFRFKILVAVLFLVTLVVSLITFTMARMFHEDKAAYVSDLASVIAVHAADEATVVLGGFRDRLLELGQQYDEPELAADARVAGMRADFSSMTGVVAVRLLEGGAAVTTMVDTSALARAGADRERLMAGLDQLQAAANSAPPVQPRIANATTSPRFPAMAMTVNVPRPAGRPPLVVIGVMDQQRALSLGRGSKAFEVFLTDDHGNVLSHADPRFVAGRTRFDWMPQLPAGSLALAKEYSRGGVDMIGGFARTGFPNVVAGAQIPRSAAFFATRRLLRDLVVVALVLLLSAAVISLWWSGRVTRSLARLAKAAKVIGRGDFGTRVDVDAGDEMGQLAQSFNQMAGELQTRDQALRQAQMALIQSEKMAAFGQLGAGIAHEVKNPLAGIQGIVQLAARGVKPDEPMHQTLAIIEKETKRCRAIIDNLLKFARQEKLEPEPMDVSTVIVDTAAILRHQMSLHRVELRTSAEQGLPPILGSANQLQQVLMNLMLNAEQAIEESGKGGVVEVSAVRAGEHVELRVRDDGPGIPAHIVPRVFEPFFTTKPTGKGTGLGLSVTFGIVRDHGGTIRVESAEGQGTTFVIALPLPQAESDAAPDAPATPNAEGEQRAA